MNDNLTGQGGPKEADAKMQNLAKYQIVKRSCGSKTKKCGYIAAIVIAAILIAGAIILL